MPSLAYWWLSSQWQCYLSLPLLSKGRSAKWQVGCLGVCWMQRKSTLLETWQAGCLYTSVLWLAYPGPSSTLISTLQLQHHHWYSLCFNLSWLLFALGWLLLQPLLWTGTLYCSAVIQSSLYHEDVLVCTIFLDVAVIPVYSSLYSTWL